MMSTYNNMLGIYVVKMIPFQFLTGNDYEENKFDAERDRGNFDPTKQIKIIEK